jgi:GTP cyclohydrolase I
MNGNDTAMSETTTSTKAVLDEAGNLSFDHEKAQRGVKLLLEAVGRDPDSDPLAETWVRRVPETLETLTEGSRQDAKPELRTFEYSHDELVVKTGIPLYSLCEHHLLPYHGTAHVAYRPNGHVVGLSKLVRYVRWQSRRLTIQETLTQDIAGGLAEEINSPAVLVAINATHLCEAMRGVEIGTESSTLAIAGAPSDQERRRFLDAVSGGSP